MSEVIVVHLPELASNKHLQGVDEVMQEELKWVNTENISHEEEPSLRSSQPR